ncbi:ABC transporter substrate-binding protein [Caloranaerobacter azorensis]|uniref:Sugar ABC transporter substrate-binding protein n=1 Tax=Caloranaerobacter azorensis TaxID=116090 RepID=A0A6P1YCF9_9FIRM|nr:sugar ABC transporter substrate-binding protein [Caloranaerobacter azorensis]QIB26891.1 sugar ABC transporter substrate-binding protein [Caloranaerobacter azorensis]
MKKKLIQAFVQIIVVLLILSSPLLIVNYRKQINEKRIEKEEPWKGVITLWDFPRLNVKTGSRYGWILDKIKKFERENPGVYIEFKPIDWKKGTTQLEEAVKTGRYPDIAPIAADFNYMKKGILEPLDNYFTKEEKNKFKCQALRAVTYNGKMWGVPFMMTTYVMYLNLDLFIERGVEPPIDGNWTYEEFVEKMKMLTWDSDNDGEIDHYGFNSFIKPNYYNVWGIILSDGADIIDENSGEYVFYGDKALKGLNKLIDLKYKYKVTPEDFGILNENEAWEMFYKKKNVAVYPTGTWALRVLENLKNKGEGFEFTVANYPIGDMRLPVSLNNSVSAYGIFKQEDEAKLKMCVKFLKYITQEKYQRELEDLGVFPVKTGITDLYMYDNKVKRIENSLSYTKIIPRHEKWKEIDRILQSQIKLALIGEKSSKEALDDAKKQIQKLYINDN